jgi:hypothetical protein
MPIIVDRPYGMEAKSFNLIDFHEKRELFVTRPPYQRKGVWPTYKKKSLIDSFFRRHYVPNIVLREVHTPDRRALWEVVDGQQRIITVQDFFNEKFKLPNSLKDITLEAGKYHTKLSPDVQSHIERQTMTATVLTGLTNPDNRIFQKHVTEIFWRLQQGEKLTYIEEEHSKLYSAARNYITINADDISFDYTKYQPVDINPNRHLFFNILPVKNNRMQHLALLARFLMLEKEDGPADLGEKYLSNFIDEWADKDLKEFEKENMVRYCRKTLDVFYTILKDDPAVASGIGQMPELDREYIIISMYLLVRKLVHGGWAFNSGNYPIFRKFIHDFYIRWDAKDENDPELLLFRADRQQNERSVENRDQLISKWFFEANPTLDKLDPQRNFTYAERIKIYRKNKGLCQKCIKEGNEKNAYVSWKEFDADHLKAHIKGGKTSIENGQVLCRFHNRSKGSGE